MPTIDSKELIDKLIANNGKYEDDPPVLLICKYINDWKNISYHISYSTNEVSSLFSSPHCHNIEILWTNPEYSIIFQ